MSEARETPGLRISDSPYWAALWSQALQGVLDVKAIPYVKVVHPPYSTSDPSAQQALLEWTAQTSVPTMAYGDGSGRGDVIRNDWLGQLLLAEQIQPEPRLLPADPAQRVLVIGLAHELLSPQGLMWNGRLALAELQDTSGLTERQKDFFAPGNFLGGKYAYNGKGASPLENVREGLRLLDRQLAANQATGSRFFVGADLTALDVYWAYASIMARVLPPEQMPVMRVNREMYRGLNAALEDDLTPRLLEHRDRLFRGFLTCPMAVD